MQSSGNVFAGSDSILEDNARSALGKIVALLCTQTGNDFSLYKKSTLYRRIERRMDLHRIDRIASHVCYLRENPQEQDLLFKELLIGATGFFRDRLVWEYLKTDAIPALLANYPDGKTIRVWVPACSTGEEAYTLAIIFSEAIEQAKPRARYSLQIFATDLNADAIAHARQAFYAGHSVIDVSPERLARYFNAENNGYRRRHRNAGAVRFTGRRRLRLWTRLSVFEASAC